MADELAREFAGISLDCDENRGAFMNCFIFHALISVFDVVVVKFLQKTIHATKATAMYVKLTLKSHLMD